MTSIEIQEDLIVEEYLNSLELFLNEEEEWWRVAGGWLDGEYGQTVEASRTAARQLLKWLRDVAGAPGGERNISEELQAVVKVTSKAESNIKSIRKIDIAWENNDRLRDIALKALNQFNGSSESWDRSQFSVASNKVLDEISSSSSGGSLPEIMQLFKRQHADYGGEGNDTNYGKLQTFLEGRSSSTTFRRYTAVQWSKEVQYVVSRPADVRVIGGRMVLIAAILLEFNHLYKIIDDGIALQQLCLSVYRQLDREIEIAKNRKFDLLTERGKALYAFLEHPSDGSEQSIKSRLHSDMPDFTEGDVLNYGLLAENLFAILKDKATTPPLNIGILAPWGRGKTSLMKRIEAKFIAEREALLKARQGGFVKSPTLRMLRSWLKSDDMRVQHNIPYATVWFNPWNYQSSDMIWAGLANNVIEQVVEQIPGKIERELFWLQLRLARIDKDALRQDLQTRFVLWIANAVIWGLTLFSAVIIAVLRANGKDAPWGLLGIGGMSGVATLIGSTLKPYHKSISEVFSNYTKPPKYNEKLGTFHDVEADMNRVLDLCIDKEKPLVVFVDDLDRCSPSKIVEVIEAINVFISGRYNNKCYFILGMDAEVVAGALDVTYEKMRGKLASRELEQGSIGWYFLDKFIQLPFFIPVMSETKKREYLSSLLSEPAAESDASTGPSAVNEKKVAEVFRRVMTTSSASASSQAIKSSSLTAAEESELEKRILKHQVESEEQNGEIRKQVAHYGQFISSDPRSLKRFANLLRFHCGYQFLRMKKGQKYVEPRVLARWLVIMLKFPQMIRWIQWDLENQSGNSTAAEEKAVLMDQFIEEFVYAAGNAAPELEKWSALTFPRKLHPTNKTVTIGELTEMAWLKSPALFTVLTTGYSSRDRLASALECNVW